MGFMEHDTSPRAWNGRKLRKLRKLSKLGLRSNCAANYHLLSELPHCMCSFPRRGHSDYWMEELGEQDMVQHLRGLAAFADT